MSCDFEILYLVYLGNMVAVGRQLYPFARAGTQVVILQLQWITGT